MTSHQKSTTPPCCQAKAETGKTVYRDPVCGMAVCDSETNAHWAYENNVYYFCSAHCLSAFKANPAGFSAKATAATTSAQIKSVASGIAGGVALLAAFLGIVTLTSGSFASSLNELRRIWYWVALLTGGFGVQLGLFVYLKQVIHERMAGVTAEVAASGTISTGSMIACCSHAMVNLLPLLGVSVAAAFLIRYQLPLILLGVVSNLVGLTMMLGLFQKHHLLPKGCRLKRINMKTARFAVILTGVVVVVRAIYMVG